MKKILALIMCAILLVGTLAVTVFAAKEEETDLIFSVKGAEGNPGDIIDIEVYLDKNPGTWACKFETHFNERYFTLLSVDNGDVFTDSEFMKGLLTKRGKYEYYAEGHDPNVNNHNTGLILTLTFEINKEAPAGEHDISIFFPDNGEGWFFDMSNFPEETIQYTVSCKNVATVKIGKNDGAPADTDASTKPSDETTAAGDKETETNKAPETMKPAPGLPVYEVVTDDEGDVKRDEEGGVVTKHAYDSNGNFLYYETDRDGDVVTDEDGKNVEFADTTGKDEETTKAPDAGSDGSEGDATGGFSAYKVILIAAVGAVIVGAIIVIIVLTRPKKNEKNSDK